MALDLGALGQNTIDCIVQLVCSQIEATAQRVIHDLETKIKVESQLELLRTPVYGRIS